MVFVWGYKLHREKHVVKISFTVDFGNSKKKKKKIACSQNMAFPYGFN